MQTRRELTRFLVVGVINTIFGYSLFALFLFAGLHYTLAVLFATVLGVLFNFKTIGHFVFENSDNRLIVRFVSVYVIIYFINVGGLWCFEQLQINLYIAGALLLIPLALISFILNKYFVYGIKKCDHPEHDTIQEQI